MLNFKDYITEGAEGKLLHLHHLEEMIFEGGVYGTRSAINFLQSLRDMLSGHSEKKVNITRKYDGAPAIICGINPENGKFFVGTKGVFAKNGKVNYTNADIDKNHPGEGLNAKLKVALRYLPELNIKGVIQGDMMFVDADLKSNTIDGSSYVTFQPNTIAYAIPEDSALARTIRAAKMGIIWHTSYVGSILADMKATPGVNIKTLTPSKNVWFKDADFQDTSGSSTFTHSETQQINVILAEVGKLFRSISPRVLNEIAENETYKIYIKAWNNQKVRSGIAITNTVAHTQGLILGIENKLNAELASAKKSDTRLKRAREKTIIMNFFTSNKNELKKIFDLYNLLTNAKNLIVSKLNTVTELGTFLNTDNGFKVTNDEGFVAVDTIGNMVKLVDRLQFSTANFNAAKAWSK